MELTADFYEKEEKEKDKPFNEFSYINIFDMSDNVPAEIEIEEEIRMGFLWKKYKQKSK
ncbi:MAG: hypothetical protein ACFFDK_07045 [Promethearchaeota archaeon]